MVDGSCDVARRRLSFYQGTGPQRRRNYYLQGRLEVQGGPIHANADVYAKSKLLQSQGICDLARQGGRLATQGLTLPRVNTPPNVSLSVE